MAFRPYQRSSVFDLEHLFQEKGEVETIRTAILAELQYRGGKRVRALRNRMQPDATAFPTRSPISVPLPTPSARSSWNTAAPITPPTPAKVPIVCPDCETPNFVFDLAGVQNCFCSSCRRPFIASKGEGAITVSFPPVAAPVKPKVNWLMVAIVVAILILALAIFLK